MMYIPATLQKVCKESGICNCRVVKRISLNRFCNACSVLLYFSNRQVSNLDDRLTTQNILYIKLVMELV